MSIWFLIVGILFIIIGIWSWLVYILEDTDYCIHDVTCLTILGAMIGPAIGIVSTLVYFIGIK